MRLDQYLVVNKICDSRNKAQNLIKTGEILVNDRVILKTGYRIGNEDNIRSTATKIFVGRGGQKLAAALEFFNINPQGMIVADIGASTGGFSDVLLQQGAEKIYAIDVGHDQLAEKIKNHPRVINLEKTNIKDIHSLPEKLDLAVIDLSYISLTKVLIKIKKLLKNEGQIIVLLKPQFEGGPNMVNSSGVISKKNDRQQIVKNFQNWLIANNFQLMNKIPSPIKGKRGNCEYLLLIH